MAFRPTIARGLALSDVSSNLPFVRDNANAVPCSKHDGLFNNVLSFQAIKGDLSLDEKCYPPVGRCANLAGAFWKIEQVRILIGRMPLWKSASSASRRSAFSSTIRSSFISSRLTFKLQMHHPGMGLLPQLFDQERAFNTCMPKRNVPRENG